ncbi:MAG: hypothetical protein KDE47_08395 [Caldilineaceae bacterium]|nr:hypothetical protein [Caldilineaceae bacterium]
MLPDLRAYERFIYTLPQQFPVIERSTLVLILHGPAFAELNGSLLFAQDVVLHVWEDLDFIDGVITGYSYGAFRGAERLYWYDPQPHPNTPDLALNHPHHKHVPPNIKRNRIPAPELSFHTPNLPFLITEIEQTLHFE